MKIINQKGFVQIPILIAIIVGIFAVGGVAYLGINNLPGHQPKYKRNRADFFV